MKKARLLPAMPFGAASALTFETEAACAAFTERLPDAPSRFGAIGPGAEFRARLRNVALPGVSLVAGASSPKATTHLGTRASLVIPFARCETVLRTAGGEYRWAAPHHAFFIPAGESIAAESTAGAFLRIDVVEDALARTAAGMADTGNSRGKGSELRTARTVDLQGGRTNWLPVIRSLCQTVDAFDCDARRLEATGFDDVVLRTVVMMLSPELASRSLSKGAASRGFDLAPLLEMIMARLDSRMTLADMERWTGLSARTIQLGFEKQFGLGPMQWVRERRLDLFRAKLLAASPDATVAAIAESCGITRLATLSPRYVRRFGELPSETLRRRTR